MGTNKRKPNCQKLAERTRGLAQDINQLIADIESDLDAPAAAAFEAKAAYVALVNVWLSLDTAARDLAVRHYQGLVDEARAAA